MIRPADGVFRDGERALSRKARLPHRLPQRSVQGEGRWPSRFTSASPAALDRRSAEGETPPGARLQTRSSRSARPTDVNIVPVECLSACNKGCSVALSAPGRWSYVYGRMSEVNAPDIVVGAAAYAARPTGSCHGARAPKSSASNRSRGIPPMSLAGGRRMTSLAKIPVTVITGFLGSGKTTLIRHL